MRKICVVTGTRAEYGLLRWVMQGVKDDPDLALQVIATGTHLSPEFGLTYREIEEDGFRIDRKVEMLLSSDTPSGVTKSMALGLIGFSDAYSELQPDLILILGDRFEIFSAASAALVARIPLAHIHGGETSEGSYDEAFRHSITKMAHLHFVAAEEYRRRVIQLGEWPRNIFLVGGLGIDGMKKMQLLDRCDLETELGLKFDHKNLLITFHPATLDADSAGQQLKELLLALADLQDTKLIFTLPNSDTGSRELIKIIQNFVSQRANAHVFTSLGHLKYLSCVAQVDCVVGNSSSGLIEVPSFKKATINIGDRQRGRLQSDSIINCAPSRDSIGKALSYAYSDEFQEKLTKVINLYEQEDSSAKVVKILKRHPLSGILKKSFYDISANIGNGGDA
jgi:GDP/UDP-N,N'-diacetylbacillosamine 2-epimerase (hydrolysing)